MESLIDELRKAAKESFIYSDLLRKTADTLANVQPVKWIPVTERLPESPFGCLLVVWDSTYNRDDFLNLLPYFAGWDGEQWNDADGEQIPFEVEYWMPLPEPPEENEHD